MHWRLQSLMIFILFGQTLANSRLTEKREKLENTYPELINIKVS